MTYDGWKKSIILKSRTRVPYRLGIEPDELEPLLRSAEGAWAEYANNVRMREPNPYDEIRRSYANGAELPADRRGLLAMFHPLLASVMSVEHTARVLAATLQQRVYVVVEESRWKLLLLAIERASDEDGKTDGLWYDDHLDGEYANDQYIAHYDPDGSYHLDGLS